MPTPTRLAAVLALLLFAAGPIARAADEPAAEPTWRIDEAHGPTSTASFEVEEGTWLSLDVHPDGQRLVMSLLGDLYLLPIDGGKAQRITSGPAYDVEPRFSPDGRWIAFASDRGGSENLWICDLEGGQARQVSREDEANGPAWTPDGQYLVGRARITDRSSIGSVELRLWHLRGGEGVVLTNREEINDAADPVLSADGRYVFFSGRAGRYNYDSDVYQGIWQLYRYDRNSGQAAPLTSLYGGATAPALSPDGQRIAFVRRIDAATELQLMDLASGAVRSLARGLTEDNQQGFATHGTFPGYAWTPDGKALIATAEGRLWRFDAHTGERTPIPFQAQVEQTITQALRFPHRVGGETFQARLIRWPVESPDGRWLVFSAVGQLYAQTLPDGKPHRLTTSQDLEYAPAFSSDGRQLAFVTWDDRRGGHVWMAPFADGRLGTARRLTAGPGDYVNPAFSPDGKRLVYVQSSGTPLRDRDLGDEPWHEIRWLEVSGGASHLVTSTPSRGTNRRMPRPAFSTDGERIFYAEDQEGESPRHPAKTVLISVKPDGTDRWEHLRWPLAEEVALSPDGRWAAFSQEQDVYLTALPLAGRKTVDLTLDKDAVLPVAKLTAGSGGEWLSWADAGRTVTWIHGPGYRRMPLSRALPEPPPEPPAEGAKPEPPPEPDLVAIDLQLPRARGTGVVAYRGARIVTMHGDQVIDDGVLVVNGERIEAVGSATEIAIPDGAEVVDLAGRTVVPGFVDEHAHPHYGSLDVLPRKPWQYLANLAYGITTVHDPSAPDQEVFAQAEMVEAGASVGPRVFSTGYVLYGAEDPHRATIESLDDARHHVRRLKELGAFTVKSYMQPRRIQRQWLLQAGREEQVMVVPEGGGDLEANIGMILDGHTTVEHALPMAPLYQDVIRLFAASQTSYTPTLLVAYGGLSPDRWFHQHLEVFRDPKLRRFVPPDVLERVTRIRGLMAPEEDWQHPFNVAASARDVLRAGTRVCLGSHGQMQGLGAHWELQLFVKGGMTPLEALRVATLLPAQTLGLDQDLGSLEPGKLADFVVLERNPLEAIENTDSVELVVKGGIPYRPQDLERVTFDPASVDWGP